jgi:primary-amine oxidase
MVLSVASRFLVFTEVSPAEYVWNYFFYQDGSIELEVRLMGIFQTHVAGPNEPAPYATHVTPGIHAHFHRHLFSVCVDPMVDGLLNSVIEMDVLLATTGYSSPENFAGNAFQIHNHVLHWANEGVREWDASADWHWRIVSAGKRHHASGQLMGYSIGVKGGAMVALLCLETLEGWVVCEKDDAREGGWMWPSGKFVPQAHEEPVDSLVQWVYDDGNTSERF